MNNVVAVISVLIIDDEDEFCAYCCCMQQRYRIGILKVKTGYVDYEGHFAHENNEKSS